MAADHDCMIAIQRDVKWIRERLEAGERDFERQEKRIGSLEVSRGKMKGVLAVLAALAAFVGFRSAADWFGQF